MSNIDFLPISKEEMLQRGWEEVDFVYVIGDAYVDHPSFGPAIISRILEREGYKVGIIAQPDWRNADSISVFGKPRLGFLVSSGNMDSMVNHYTVARRRRSKDAYSPGGEMGLRPDRAAIVYSNMIRKLYKDSPIIAGGIEASLRRFAHYDYWDDAMRRSILIDSAVDLVSFGMGERSIIEIADALDSGLSIQDLTFIDGTAFTVKTLEHVYDYALLPEWESIASAGKDDAQSKEYARGFAIQYAASDALSGERLVEKYSDRLYVVQNPPSRPLSESEMDAVYRLPFARAWHPSYDAAGGVPALSEVKFSVTSSRGCFGECAFCALTFHQGRVVSARSSQSILDEVKAFTYDRDFKGYVSDIGGPTANFFHPACAKQEKSGACVGKRCLSPTPCKALDASHARYVQLLKEVRKIPGVKKVFVRSGVRYDYALLDDSDDFLEELIGHHVSGQLRVAPEHVSDKVLSIMGKPSRKVYERFVERFQKITAKAGKEQYVLPYLMSSHPGSGLAEAIELAEFVRDMGYNPEQVQDFYPTPTTLSTVMYCTGYDPRTLEPVYVARSKEEKAMQRALIQYRNPKNRHLVEKALKLAGREDLIGYGPKCLIRPSRRKKVTSKR